MSDNSKVKVKGVEGRSSRNLSSDHVTTIDFNVVKPFGIYEMIPGDRISISPEVWMRTQAMNCPTFGKVDVITRAFFVPHRLVFRHFLDFWRQNSYGNGNGLMNTISKVFNYKMKDLTERFLVRFEVCDSDAFVTERVPMSVIESSGVATRFHFGVQLQDTHYQHDYEDFCISKGADKHHYRFNPLGKRVYDIFISLGYRFQMFSTISTSHDTHNQGEESNVYEVSLLPILSWLKIFNDWYCPNEFRYLFSIDEFCNKTTIYANDLDEILDMCTWACYLFYNDDLFSLSEHEPYNKQKFVNDSIVTQKWHQVSASPNEIVSWDKAFNVSGDNYQGAINGAFQGEYSTSEARSKLSSQGSDILGLKSSESASSSTVNAYSTAGVFANALNNSISAWSVKAVVKAAHWLQKNNLLTKRAEDYIKAKFNVAPSAVRMDITEYIGSASKPLQISEVVSTQGGETLGELGGKGTAYSIDNLKYTAEEFGYFIVTIEMRPRIEYGQGVNPLVLRTNVEDFYQEEFDGLGFTPVPTQCLNAGPMTGMRSFNYGDTYNLGNVENRIFGYLPKYWSYKIAHGNLSGDFGIPKNIDIQSYHLFRYVGGSILTEYTQNSLSFRYSGLGYYDNNFNRIFVDSSTLHLKDHFILIGSFDCWINGVPLALNESWMVNEDGEERQGSLHHVQSVI